MQNRSVLFAAVVSGLILALLFLTRQGMLTSPHAASPDELRQIVFKREQATIEREIGQRVSTSTTLAASKARWQTLQQSMQTAGATPNEAKLVLATAKNFLPTRAPSSPRAHWPVSVKRGYVNKRPMWVTICVAAADDPKLASSIKGWNYWVSVIDPQKPKELASNQVFPRLRDALG